MVKGSLLVSNPGLFWAGSRVQGDRGGLVKVVEETLETFVHHASRWTNTGASTVTNAVIRLYKDAANEAQNDTGNSLGSQLQYILGPLLETL